MGTSAEVKKSVCAKVLDTLATIATNEVKKAGKFTLPGLCMIKTRVKPATKAGKREIFGKMQIVKAKPAKTIVKAFPVAALKKHLIEVGILVPQASLSSFTVDFLRNRRKLE